MLLPLSHSLFTAKMAKTLDFRTKNLNMKNSLALPLDTPLPKLYPAQICSSVWVVAYDLCSSPVKSVIGSTENESDKEDFLAGLTHHFSRTFIKEADKSMHTLNHLEVFRPLLLLLFIFLPSIYWKWKSLLCSECFSPVRNAERFGAVTIVPIHTGTGR